MRSGTAFTFARRPRSLPAASAIVSALVLLPLLAASLVTSVPAASSVPPASLFAKSVFNLDVQGWAVDPSSQEYVADVVADYKSAYGTVGVNTLPVYQAPGNQPAISVSAAAGCGNFTGETGRSVPIPDDVSFNGSGDSPLVVYKGHTEWEFWKASRLYNGSYTACWGGRLNMASSDGVFPFPWGLSATGISYLATTVTEADIESGSIGHAIAVILPRCDGPPVYPADRGDCGNDPGQPHEGQWFRFAPGTTMPGGLTPFGRMVFRAISVHGMVVVDQGGCVCIEAEQESDWAAQGHQGTDPLTRSFRGQPEYSVVARLPWWDLQAVDPPGH